MELVCRTLLTHPPTHYDSRRALYRALSHRLLAQAHWEKNEHGVAIGLLGQAQALLKTRPDGTSTGLPPIDRSKVRGRLGKKETVSLL